MNKQSGDFGFHIHEVWIYFIKGYLWATIKDKACDRNPCIENSLKESI